MGDAIRVIDRRLARCQFRPAPQARTEQCFLRGERAFEETAIFLQRCFHWTDRPAVNSGGGDADEKNPVEARIGRDPLGERRSETSPARTVDGKQKSSGAARGGTPAEPLLRG